MRGHYDAITNEGLTLPLLSQFRLDSLHRNAPWPSRLCANTSSRSSEDEPCKLMRNIPFSTIQLFSVYTVVHSELILFVIAKTEESLL